MSSGLAGFDRGDNRLRVPLTQSEEFKPQGPLSSMEPFFGLYKHINSNYTKFASVQIIQDTVMAPLKAYFHYN